MHRSIKIVLVLLVILTALILQSIPDIQPFTWMIFLTAVIFSSMIDGLRGAILSVLISSLWLIYYILPPSHSFSLSDISDYLYIAGFIFLGLISGLIADWIKRLEKSLKIRNEELTRINVELWQNEQKLRYHLENSPLAVIEWDKNFIVTQWSKEAEHLFGWKADETIGKPLSELKMVYDEDLPVLAVTMERLSAGKELTIASSNRNYTKSGDIIECNWYNSVLLDTKGKMSSVMSLVEDITELKKNIIELRESGKKYHELVKYAPAGIYEIDFRTRRFLSVNDAMVLLSGYPAEELMNMDVADILDEESRMVFANRIKKMLAGESQPENVIYKIRKKNGDTLYASLNIQFKLSNGAVIGAFVVGHDITERVRIETALKESEERLKFAMETIKTGVWELDLVNHTAFRSIEHDRIFGYRELLPEWTYEMFLDHVVPEDRTAVDTKFKYAQETATPWNFECRIRRKDGEVRWIWAAGRLYSGDKNRLAGIVQDITERKQSEAELLEAQHKLNIALENACIGIWEWNIKTDEVQIDERTEKMFGLKPGLFNEDLRSFEKLINEEDISHFREAVKKTLENDKPFETILRLKNLTGQTRYINLKGFISHGEGRITNQEKWLTGVCFDITEMKQGTEKLISKINEDLLRSNNDLQQFAYVASHDLQEPLRMISSFTQLLQQRYHDKLDEDANEYIKFAVEGSKRMYDLLNGLLSYSRVNTRGKEFTEVDMNSVISKVKDNLKLVLQETGAEIHYDNLPSITGDDNQMIQLMQNLIDNGIKFSTGKPCVTISCRKEGNFEVFSVKDEGIGIDPQYYDKIFRIFQRLHHPKEYSGTGIGLAICKRIIERHNGKIWIESIPGNGSKFMFSIPAPK